MALVRDEQRMADKRDKDATAPEDRPADRDDERLSRPLPASSPSRTGFFTIYKSGQGYWTRMGTVGGAVLIAILSVAFLYEQVPVLVRSFVTPHTSPTDSEDQIRMANAHVDSVVTNTKYAVCLAFLAGFSLLTFWLINKPSNADFLIATDSEMKKVNWTSREELIGSTKVVIAFMFLIAFLLFGLDVFFGYFFKLLTVLKAGPFG